jgi:hypothetical protein
MIFPLLGGRKVAAALDQWFTSPFRHKHYKGMLDVEAIEWAISWLQVHPDAQSNPNSRYWIDRLRANLHHHKLDAAMSQQEGK